MDAQKKRSELLQRVQYARDILGRKESQSLEAVAKKIEDFNPDQPHASDDGALKALRFLAERLAEVEAALDRELSPMDRVRIVRHPQRVCLKDILENVYDNYTEIGGQDEHSIDPGMLIARAYVTRRKGKKLLNHPVMVVGQEKGHGEEFRNGGSIKPWGNSKALKYMKVAARENIPIHTYVFTPGSYPIEDFPGAAQQIAENLYEMAGLAVPIVSVISEGGSGGAEAIGLSDRRLMLSHGYYSVISPEGAAAIEGRVKPGQRAPAELIERCALHQRITAHDNLAAGFVDAVIEEPPLGARPEHFDFFRRLRAEVIRATDEVALGVRGMRLFRKLAMRGRERGSDGEDIIVRWQLNERSRERLLARRYRKYRGMALGSFEDKRSPWEKLNAAQLEIWAVAHSAILHGLIRRVQTRIATMADEATDEFHVVTGRLDRLTRKVLDRLGVNLRDARLRELGLTTLSAESQPGKSGARNGPARPYVSPKALEDREVTCPNSAKRGCMDIWARDLFGEFAGVCPHCGHHFPLEHQWYLANVFDPGSIREFNRSIASGNPTGFPGFAERIDAVKRRTGFQSSCLTFSGSVMGLRLVCGMLMAEFQGGSVGAAEGEKFIRALELARKMHQPFWAYVHGTAGIRIQEGLHGLIQMPRCTMAVRRYIEAGGLYVVLYDTNSYAGPVASFLGCSPYQYAVRSSRIGFAGPGVIKETTGLDIPPDYHVCHKALSRGHIQDVWDRRDIRANLHHALLTIGGRNIYYR